MSGPRITAPRSIGVVADDFTGAADAAGTFACHGWEVRLSVGGAARTADPGMVLAVSTGARELASVDAEEATRRAVERLLAARVERLFVKVDSTGRGPVGAYVAGALAAWGESSGALICPAFPAQGRTVRDGELLVDDIPVDESDSGRDRLTPVSTSALAELFEVPDADDGGDVRSRIVLADAETDDDLDALAARIAVSDAVAVGSAGLAAGLARVWALPGAAVAPEPSGGPVLVAASSRHPVTIRQLAALREADPSRTVDVVSVPAEPRDDAAATAAEFGSRVAEILRGGGHRAVIICGGDGAAAVLAALGAEGVRIDAVLVDGCPSGTIVGGAVDGVRIVTKSGGFGQPGALVGLVDVLGPPLSTPETRPALEAHSPTVKEQS
ncbi:MAG: four-carbon acid sugar kinase family protein [Microbacterium sp.]